ncbi:MAG: hypothetical protein Q8L55_05765, partial [Phycisphaerales bacterium]|nr:hypothetical protein [Phycisphaerales bacterium]
SPLSGEPFDPAAPLFPTTAGDSLNKRRIEIPAGLDAPYNILMVAFLREHQEDVDTWLPAAREIAADHANVEYYELPTVRNGGPLFKWFLDSGMRSGIPAFAARERTVTLYLDTARFRELAGIDGGNRIWVGLVDRAGRVYWSKRGPADAGSLAELRRVVRQTAAPDAP